MLKKPPPKKKKKNRRQRGLVMSSSDRVICYPKGETPLYYTKRHQFNTADR